MRSSAFSRVNGALRIVLLATATVCLLIIGLSHAYARTAFEIQSEINRLQEEYKNKCDLLETFESSIEVWKEEIKQTEIDIDLNAHNQKFLRSQRAVYIEKYGELLGAQSWGASMSRSFGRDTELTIQLNVLKRKIVEYTELTRKLTLEKEGIAQDLDGLRDELKNPNPKNIGGEPKKATTDLPPSGVPVPPIGSTETNSALADPGERELIQIFRDNVFFEVGGGINFPNGDRTLIDFNQGIESKNGSLGYLAVGGIIPESVGPNDVGLAIVGQVQRNDNSRLVNNPPFAGALNIGGRSSSYSIYPRLTIEGPLLGTVDWRVGVGAGVAIQQLNVTVAGIEVLSGSATTPMANLNAGFSFPIADRVDFGIDAFATWFDGYTVRTNTGVPSKLDSYWDTGVVARIRFRTSD